VEEFGVRKADHRGKTERRGTTPPAYIEMSSVSRSLGRGKRPAVLSFELERQKMTPLSPLLKNTVDGPKLMEEFLCRRVIHEARN
jgi:hypothetical protein